MPFLSSASLLTVPSLAAASLVDVPDGLTARLLAGGSSLASSAGGFFTALKVPRLLYREKLPWILQTLNDVASSLDVPATGDASDTSGVRTAGETTIGGVSVLVAPSVVFWSSSTVHLATSSRAAMVASVAASGEEARLFGEETLVLGVVGVPGAESSARRARCWSPITEASWLRESSTDSSVSVNTGASDNRGLPEAAPTLLVSSVPWAWGGGLLAVCEDETRVYGQFSIEPIHERRKRKKV